MTNPLWATGPPKTILLATDLSSRCDRALDRAAMLTRAWAARLVVLHVMEPDYERRRRLDETPSWRRPADREAVMKARVGRDLLEHGRQVEVRVAEGEAAATIDGVARELGAGLVVVGMARDEPLGRYFLGSTVERLLRQTPIPLLVTKSRARPYGEVLVAIDFSESSRHAVVAAANYFPRAPLTLLHAWEVPFAGFLDKGDFSAQYRAMEQEACERFVAEAGLAGARRSDVRVLLERGAPEVMVRAYMLDKGVDLVVVGTHGRSGAFDVLIGSTAKRILEHAPGDVLVVREPRSVQQAPQGAAPTSPR
jgi:nucleotide-binding universal stress UspA family protein